MQHIYETSAGTSVGHAHTLKCWKKENNNNNNNNKTSDNNVDNMWFVF